MNCLQQEADKRYSNAIAEGNVIPPTPFKVTELDPTKDPAHKELFLFTGGFASCRRANQEHLE